MSISELKNLKAIRDNLNNAMEQKFRDMRKDCSYCVLEPPPSRGDDSWYKCINLDHPYFLASITSCCVNDCPLLRRKNGKEQDIKGIGARKSSAK